MDNPRFTALAMPALSFRVLPSLSEIPRHHWDALTGSQPLLSHAFLQGLHESGCASLETGWSPQYVTAWRGDVLVGAMPLYSKAHSYGEYVFDWSWADAYRRYGRRYYPKLVCAIPFTPATGSRLLAAGDDVKHYLVERA